MKSVKEVGTKVADIDDNVGQNALKSVKKRVAKPTSASNKNSANAGSEISKLTLTENDQNTYDLSVTFSNNPKPADHGKIKETDVHSFFTTLFASTSKQANPTLRSKPPKPPKIIDITF